MGHGHPETVPEFGDLHDAYAFPNPTRREYGLGEYTSKMGGSIGGGIIAASLSHPLVRIPTQAPPRTTAIRPITPKNKENNKVTN